MKKKTPHAHKLPPAIETSPSLAAALAENERLAKLLDELRQEIVALKQENAALKRENIALRDRLNQNSANSNQPPSQDSPFGEPQQQADSAARESEERAESKAKKSRPYHKGFARGRVSSVDRTARESRLGGALPEAGRPLFPVREAVEGACAEGL